MRLNTQTASITVSAELDCHVIAVEPNIEHLPETLSETGIKLMDLPAAVERADILVLLVDHRPFKRLPASRRAEKVIIDTRGIWS